MGKVDVHDKIVIEKQKKENVWKSFFT